jgi:hypothetical protein
MPSIRPSALFVLTVFASALIGACAVPEGDQSSPSQVHYLWLKVRAANDVPRMWELLHPEHREEIKRWHSAEKDLLTTLQRDYPAEDATAAIAAIGGPKRGEAQSPEALFAQLVKPPPAEPGGLGAAGARVRSENLSEDGMSASLRTHGGDEIAVRKGPEDKWFVTLQPDELVLLTNARERAEQNLARVRANLKKLGTKK